MSEDEREYCNICENFPCLGGHPPDVHAEALEWYERAAAYIRDGLVARPAGGLRPIYFSPLRNSLVIREAFEQEATARKRRAEEQDRREWTEGIRRRLGLVAEVHRCRVYRCGPGDWGWFCQREGPGRCGEVGHYLPSLGEAVGAAQEHTRAFIPEPLEEMPATELDLLAFDALWARMRAQQDAVAAALPGRMDAVAGQINEYLAGVLPDGVRFEWAADGADDACDDEGSMEEFVAYLVSDGGYSRNECPDRCPHKTAEHAHLHSPGNPASTGTPPGDFIYWGDGTSSHSDPTRGRGWRSGGGT